MKESATNPERVFVLGGLSSALLTVAIGSFWLGALVLATGVIFSVVLLTTDNMIQRKRPLDARTPLSRTLLAAAIVALSYPCGVAIFVATVSLFDRLEIGLRNVIGLGTAGAFMSFAFYWALTIMTKTKRTGLLQLLLVALVTTLIAGTTEFWGRNLTMLKPPIFLSPFWISLFVMGESGFAWVWGKASRASRCSGQILSTKYYSPIANCPLLP